MHQMQPEREGDRGTPFATMPRTFKEPQKAFGVNQPSFFRRNLRKIPNRDFGIPSRRGPARWPWQS